MRSRSFYVIQIRLSGCRAGYREFLACREREISTYGGRPIPAKWYRTDTREGARQFETPGRARSIARRLKIVKEIVHCGGAWEILHITEEVVEASDESPLLGLARVAK